MSILLYFTELIYKYIRQLSYKMTRPLGAFLSKWTNNSREELKTHGFTEDKSEKIKYKGVEVTVLKFKTQHDPIKDKHIHNYSQEIYDNNTFHHLDFYLDNNNKLINTQVYTSKSLVEERKRKRGVLGAPG